MNLNQGSLPGLHHELAGGALLVEIHALGDDVLVAAPVAQVLAPPLLDVAVQPVAGHAVGHDRGAGVLPAGRGLLRCGPDAELLCGLVYGYGMRIVRVCVSARSCSDSGLMLCMLAQIACTHDSHFCRPGACRAVLCRCHACHWAEHGSSLDSRTAVDLRHLTAADTAGHGLPA